MENQSDSSIIEVRDFSKAPSSGVIADACAVPATEMVGEERSAATASPAPAAEPPARSVWFSRAMWALPFLAGVLLPATGALNAQSSMVLGGASWAVATTYTIASVLCLSWAFFTGKKKTKTQGFRDLKVFLLSGRWRWCCLLGGVLGASQNIISAEVSPVLGTGLMTTGILLGQIIMSMVCDTTGFAWAKKVGVHPFTLFGGVIVCIGCILYRFALFLNGLDDGREDQSSVGVKIGCIVFALIYGVANCIQAGVGGQMGRQLGHFRRASAWAFTSGCFLMYIVAAIDNPHPTYSDVTGSDWWKFCAAPISMFYSAVAAIVPTYLSFSAVFSCIVAGQLVGSTILDANGWLGLLKRNLDLYNIFGILTVMVGVFFVTRGKKKQIARNAASEIAAAAAKEEIAGGGSTEADPTTPKRLSLESFADVIAPPTVTPEPYRSDSVSA